MHKSGGFTIVEIIIVCVVIGILAALTVATWNNVMNSSQEENRQLEQRDWAKRFESYRNRFGVFPNATSTGTAITGEHCLGTGFTGGRCKFTNSSGIVENGTSDIMNELAKLGSLPQYAHVPVNTMVGPWAQFNTSTIRVYQVYQQASCPEGTVHDTTITAARACYIQFTKN